MKSIISFGVAVRLYVISTSALQEGEGVTALQVGDGSRHVQPYCCLGQLVSILRGSVVSKVLHPFRELNGPGM